MVVLSKTLVCDCKVHIPVLQPRQCRNNVGLGYSHFARHYYGNHVCFLLLWVLRCFSSPRLLLAKQDDRPSTWRVAPFGNLRIAGYLHLPVACRSLSRPSSPLRAKVSTIRPYFLFLSFTAVNNYLTGNHLRFLFLSLLYNMSKISFQIDNWELTIENYQFRLSFECVLNFF